MPEDVTKSKIEATPRAYAFYVFRAGKTGASDFVRRRQTQLQDWNDSDATGEV